MIQGINGRGKSTGWILNRLNRPSHLEAEDERETVLSIINGVLKEGDAALLRYTKKYDKADLADPQDMRVTEEEIQEAYDSTSPELVKILERAAERIRRFHARQKTETWLCFDEKDIILGQKVIPMERVGVYVPGGKAAYPSSVLMNVIPARVAGVDEIIMVSPPGGDGRIHPSILAAAKVAGVDHIYRAGGAQAIAALAYGTGTIPKVDKIVGPGNIYVALAKKEVFGHVDIDMIAGPSEIVVVADKSARPSYVAADLMSQAEHDEMAVPVLITDSEEIFASVLQELERQTAKLPSKDIILSSLQHYGACILVDSIEKGIELSNALAPEHLELAVENPMELLARVRHAGAVFLGHYTPEPVGDYMAGPNHVLPTGGTARFFSPLSVEDFVKKSSIIFYGREALRGVYENVADFARMEGLPAHANAMEVRFYKDEDGIPS
ncbi:MAG: histidinol dehydrogenase [Caldicoprobacterales bacterium]|jgi:histidinol dehydrogenase|nr:histidinol dehydrogenase [Clostridiales bacterium]